MENAIPIGQLKTHCYKILEEVRHQSKQVVITKHNSPIATISPIHHQNPKKSIFGLLQDEAQINKDIINLDIKWNAENES